MGFPEECLANASGSLDRTLCLDIRRMLDVCILPQTIYIERVESKMRVELGSQTMMGHVAAEDIKRNVCLPLRNGGELFGLCFMEYGKKHYMIFTIWIILNGNAVETHKMTLISSADCFNFI